MTFIPINLSAYADPVLHELESSKFKLDNTVFWEIIRQVQGPVLEIGCGTGRATIPLAQRGVNITGLEASPEALHYARSKSKELGLTIEWVEADARSFHLHKHYALIFARGCVFNHLLERSDQEAMLARVHEHLADGGQFMFDLCYSRPETMRNEPDEVEWYTLTDTEGRQIYVSGTSTYDHERQLWVQNCNHRLNDANGDMIAAPWQLVLRYFMPQEIEALLHYNGFKVVSRFVDYDGALPSADHPSEVYVCEKR